MQIDIKLTSTGGYCVQADGKVIEPDAKYADLPAIIDRMYEGREDETAALIRAITDRLESLSRALRAEATALDAERDELLDICHRLWRNQND